MVKQKKAKEVESRLKRLKNLEYHILIIILYVTTRSFQKPDRRSGEKFIQLIIHRKFQEFMKKSNVRMKRAHSVSRTLNHKDLH